MSELQKLINTPSDINEHLEIMNKYARKCSHITEMGVRDIVSTWAWLEALPAKLVCYDVAQPPKDRLEQVKSFANSNNISFWFYQRDVLTIDIEPTDLLFIDTIHTYGQLKQELTLHGNKSSKYIILHDTEHFSTIGIDQYGNETEGLVRAISEFLEENKHWIVEAEYKNCFGLTILRRV